MSDPISEYQRWKQQGADLRGKAKQAIEARYRELLTEAIQLAEEYKHDFGKTLPTPAAVTAFRYKPTGRPGTKAKAPAAKKAVVPEKAVSPAIAALQKKLAAAKKKYEAAPTKNLEDRIYEIEDDIRVAQTP